MSFFDNQRHPRGSEGKFARVTGYSGPAFSQSVVRERSSGPARSQTRGEGWQRIGSKINALPRDYTGSHELSRPVGSYLSLTLTNQIPKSVSVADHQKRVARYIQLVKDSRKEIMEGAEKNRKGKKHVYLKAHEPAARGVERSRMKPDLYPEGTPKSTLVRAYHHAALVHMHERGLVDYDWKMDPDLKAELKPVEPFMRYAKERLEHNANKAFPGEKQPYHDEFAKPFPNPKFDKVTGKERKRFRPNQQLIKAAPFVAAARNLAARAAHGLDSFSVSHEEKESAFAHAGQAATRVKGLFRPRAGAANRGGYVAGRWAADKTKAFVRNPVKAVGTGMKEGARTGSGFAEGVADGFGAGARTRKVASRVGAVSGALKVPVIAGAIAAKPLEMASHALGYGNQPDKQSMAKMLAEAEDLAKRAPAIAKQMMAE
jgi:hypothetical protein